MNDGTQAQPNYPQEASNEGVLVSKTDNSSCTSLNFQLDLNVIGQPTNQQEASNEGVLMSKTDEFVSKFIKYQLSCRYFITLATKKLIQGDTV